jgi:monofunctional biosynthetic peptidoglycan transglycosylase
VKTLLFLTGMFLLVEILTIPFFAIAALNSVNPKQTALMRQRMKEADSEGKRLKIVQHWIPISRVPQHVLNAVVVAEDGTFYEHGGIDWFEVQESLEKNLEEGRAARGASTITQQLAKNLFLSTSKDPVRKLKEVIITLLMERQLSKRRILELYLNCIEWGRGVFGIEAAARTYFGKSASALTLDEGARLAAVIPSPLRHRPDANSRYVLRRKGIVLSRMFARRQIPDTTEEEDQSKSLEQSPEGESPAAPPQEEAPVVPDSSATDEGR